MGCCMSQQPKAVISSPADIAPRMAWIENMVSRGLPGGPVVVTLGREGQGRSGSSNAKFHAMITDIHRQCFRGYSFDGVKAVLVNQFAIEMEEAGTPLSSPGEKVWDWKTKEPVYVRPTTTKFKKAEAAAFVEFLYSAGSEMQVQWSEPAMQAYREYKESAQ